MGGGGVKRRKYIKQKSPNNDDVIIYDICNAYDMYLSVCISSYIWFPYHIMYILYMIAFNQPEVVHEALVKGLVLVRRVGRGEEVQGSAGKSVQSVLAILGGGGVNGEIGNL